VIASSGCYYCGGVNPVAAAATGVAVGSAVGSMVDENADADDFSAGYNAGMVASGPPTLPLGQTYASLPPGCNLQTFSQNTYYQCGNAWLQPAYGANGVYYTVVTPP
jgi:hypothetical protein